MYKIVTDEVPSYLMDLLPNRIDNVVAYDRRNRYDFEYHFQNYVHIKTITLHLLSGYGMNSTHKF